jgi:hypothetical protein
VVCLDGRVKMIEDKGIHVVDMVLGETEEKRKR